MRKTVLVYTNYRIGARKVAENKEKGSTLIEEIIKSWD